MKTLMTDNRKLFAQREEPEVLKPSSEGSYPEILGSMDISFLTALEGLVASASASLGEPVVIAEWYTPPHGRLMGYGIYPRREAEELLQVCARESWGAPRLCARLYDTDWFRDAITRLRSEDNLR